MKAFIIVVSKGEVHCKTGWRLSEQGLIEHATIERVIPNTRREVPSSDLANCPFRLFIGAPFGRNALGWRIAHYFHFAAPKPESVNATLYFFGRDSVLLTQEECRLFDKAHQCVLAEDSALAFEERARYNASSTRPNQEKEEAAGAGAFVTPLPVWDISLRSCDNEGAFYWSDFLAYAHDQKKRAEAYEASVSCPIESLDHYFV